MIRLFIVIALLANYCLAADHGMYRNCSQVRFCDKYRDDQPDPDHTYKADLSSLTFSLEGVAHLNLTDIDNTLQLFISSVNNGTFRVIIEEYDSGRYHLTDVLDGDPIVNKLQLIETSNNTIKLAVYENSTEKVVIQSDPLEIQFYYDDILETILDGSKIFMEHGGDILSQSILVKFPKAIQLYGLHEHKDNFPLQNTKEAGIDPYRLRNLDVSEHEIYSPMAIYASVPVLYAHGPEKTTGIFIHNAAEIWVEPQSGKNISQALFMLEAGVLDLFILTGPDPDKVVQQYTDLTGLPKMPPLWALGYHQSRWNYFSQEEVKDVAANFDNKAIPLDSIWLDIDYSDGRKYFIWNDKFNDPLEMQQNISQHHRKLVVIIDPHLKVDEDFYVYKEAKDADVFVKNSNNENFEGDCWPGKSSYIDFLNPKGVEYWASLFTYQKFKGSSSVLAGIWNDMNEPTVYDTTIERTMPWDNIHYGNVKHRDIHNIYGLLNTKATQLGLLNRDGGTKRPFVLTRSHFAGSQRYAGMWTGDNRAAYEDVPIGVAQCLGANMVGFAICGSDVGGFYNNPSEELLQRFYQTNAWLPFYRAHANGDTDHREPYLFSDAVVANIRRAIRLRYKHLPVWYTLFYEQTRFSTPVIRPLWFHYPTDVNLFKIDDQLLLGRDIMVKSVYEEKAQTVEVYIPVGYDDTWYRIDYEQQVYIGPGWVTVNVDLNSIPVFYRAGSILPRKDTERLSSTYTIDDCYTLYVNVNQNGLAMGRLYIDDYESFDYLNENKYTYVNLSWFDDELTIEPIDENTESNFKIDICEIVVNEVTQNSRYQQRTTKFGLPLTIEPKQKFVLSLK